MVTGLRLGPNTLAAEAAGKGDRVDRQLTLVNHPVTGPIFSGPQQQPFVCKTQTQGLGFPLVDNQAGVGMRLFQTPGNPATPLVGWSSDCSAPTVVDYRYRSTDGTFKALPDRPAARRHRADDAGSTAAPSTSSSGARAARSTASSTAIAMLAPPGDPAAAPDTWLWNGRVVYWFQGGVAIGHTQGTVHGGPRRPGTLERATRSCTRAATTPARTTTCSARPARRR